MRRTFSAALALAATFCIASAQTIPKCDAKNPCPESTPCCSQYGQCGVGAYCLGGCDPKSSFSLESCMPAPVCKSEDYVLDSLGDVESNTRYLGDTDGVNWVSSGTPVVYGGESVLLTMAPDTVGTLLMSTHYVWYGKISATMTTSQGQGVVTAFIMMSDVKDEIDFEFVGVDLAHAQSNYYFQGITDYTNSENITVSNTVENMHTYTFDWQPDQLSWAVDGKVYRTLKKEDTYKNGKYNYPQTPARVQLSLWPAGLPTNGEGTIDWSGGLINWDSNYMQNGYYYAQIKEVTVECYDAPDGTQKNGDEAYYYTSREGMEGDVAIGDKNTILGSFQASGDKPEYNPSGSADGDQPTVTAQTVPGLSGAGERGIQGPDASVSGPAGSAATGGTGFYQGSGSSDASTVVAGSAVALLGFFIAALLI